MHISLGFRWMLALGAWSLLFALPGQRWSSSKILHEIKKLSVVGSVVYVAAHPDDENTRLLAWLANEKRVETSYISLTRGDGGQNLIGPDLGPMLGLIRTRELMAARNLDGAQQYFTRAYDFGYSKTYLETFEHWHRETLLADVMALFQQRRPDVIITRFSLTPGGTHGHHTASAMLAKQAFDLLYSPKASWPTRIFWNTSPFFYRSQGQSMPDTFKVMEVGQYNPLLGMSYPELAALSRSQHRSQGFGTAPNHVETKEYFQWLGGKAQAGNDLFEGIDLSWQRFNPNSALPEVMDSLVQTFKAEKPEASVPGLVRAYRLIRAAQVPFYTKQKMKACEDLIFACLGLDFQANADRNLFLAGDTLQIKRLVLSGSPSFSGALQFSLQGPFEPEIKSTNSGFQAILRKDLHVSQPYWLEQSLSHHFFQSKDTLFPHAPWNAPLATMRVTFSFLGELFSKVVPVQFREVDPSYGEWIRPLLVYPDFAAEVKQPAVFCANKDQWQEVPVALTGYRTGVSFSLQGRVPEGWEVQWPDTTWVAKRFGQKFTTKVLVRPGSRGKGQGTLALQIRANGKLWDTRVRNVTYPHTGPVVWFEKCELPCAYVPLHLPKFPVAYLPGAGDEVAEVLSRTGLPISTLSPESGKLNFPDFGAVLCGVRLLNTVEDASMLKEKLLSFAEAGGVVVMQYNTISGLPIGSMFPGLQLGRERVTEESTPVTLLLPEHPVFTYPHLISKEDFKGWVQEIGLYAVSKWDGPWQALLSAADTGENPVQGLLLVRPYGKGWLVYTGLSFFRQIPAGQPGAMRLLLNLFHLGQKRP
jgi:LmbE family N-acetylglucosaminyl deacetylase